MIITELNRIITLLEPKYFLHSAGNENLIGEWEGVQDAIHGDFTRLDNLSYKMEENDFYGIDSALDELHKQIEAEFDVEPDRAHELYLKYEDEIKDTIYGRDYSDLIGECLRNTPDPAMFYDLHTEIGDYTEDMKLRLRTVKQALRIKLKDKTWDKSLFNMLQEAGYGGKLVIYFNISLENTINCTFRTVIFENPIVAVVDHFNGSGWYCSLPKFRITFPYDRENVFIDHTLSYNFTHDVCGMRDDWCNSTKVKFIKKKSR